MFPIFAARNFCVLLLVVALSTACSTSKTNSPETGMPLESSSPETKSDQVGSIPEDLLAAESKPPTLDAENKESSDPFADLKQEEPKPKGNTMAVIESGESLLPSSNSERSGQTESYKVKRGDTLMKIAFSLYGDLDRWKEIRDMNQDKIKANSRLRAGMELKVETPTSTFTQEELAHSYEIKNGDTLANIADDLYGKKMKYKKIQKYNSHLIHDPNKIYAGFKIFYDITPQEMAEAEARKQEKMAAGTSFGGMTSGATAAAPNALSFGGNSAVPSALNPPAKSSAGKPNVALKSTADAASGQVPPLPTSAQPIPVPAPVVPAK